MRRSMPIPFSFRGISTVRKKLKVLLFDVDINGGFKIINIHSMV